MMLLLLLLLISSSSSSSLILLCSRKMKECLHDTSIYQYLDLIHLLRHLLRHQLLHASMSDGSARIHLKMSQNGGLELKWHIVTAGIVQSCGNTQAKKFKRLEVTTMSLCPRRNPRRCNSSVFSARRFLSVSDHCVHLRFTLHWLSITLRIPSILHRLTDFRTCLFSCGPQLFTWNFYSPSSPFFIFYPR